MESNDLVTVFTLSHPPKAEIIKNFLESEGIHCFLDGSNLASVLTQITPEIKVQVRASDADRARKMIKAHESRHQE